MRNTIDNMAVICNLHLIGLGKQGGRGLEADPLARGLRVFQIDYWAIKPVGKTIPEGTNNLGKYHKIP